MGAFEVVMSSLGRKGRTDGGVVLYRIWIMQGGNKDRGKPWRVRIICWNWTFELYVSRFTLKFFNRYATIQ